jgi:hypothetical protein
MSGDQPRSAARRAGLTRKDEVVCRDMHDVFLGQFLGAARFAMTVD